LSVVAGLDVHNLNMANFQSGMDKILVYEHTTIT